MCGTEAAAEVVAGTGAGGVAGMPGIVAATGGGDPLGAASASLAAGISMPDMGSEGGAPVCPVAGADVAGAIGADDQTPACTVVVAEVAGAIGADGVETAGFCGFGGSSVAGTSVTRSGRASSSVDR